MLAASVFCVPDSESENQYDYELIAGQTLTISVYATKRISIVNPNVVDVIKATASEILLSARGPGQTVVHVEDTSGFTRVYNIKVYSKDLNTMYESLKQTLMDADLLGEVSVKQNKEIERIIIEGKLTASNKTKLDAVMAAFESDVLNLTTVEESKELVYIDVEVLEVSKDDLDKLGIEWAQQVTLSEGYIPSTRTATETSDTITTTTTTTEEEPTIQTWVPLRFQKWVRHPLSATLYMMGQDGKTRTLARPKLVVLSGKEAEVNVGGEIPILTISEGEPKVEYKDYGVILSIQPEVYEDNSIRTSLQVEVSEVDWTNAITATSGISGDTVATYEIPAFIKRTATTEVFLEEGQTLFMAGLIKNTEAKNVNKIPGLGDIPILGLLFSSQRFQEGQTELVITLTPRIIRHPSYKTKATEKPKVDLEVVSVTGEKQRGPQKMVSPQMSEYLAYVQAMIVNNITLPRDVEILTRGAQVTVKLHLSSDGTLLDARIIESSGYYNIDNTVLETIENLTYPGFPEGAKEEEVWVTIPIRCEA